ncbi:uncharacterized protein ARMOST_19660 [Armillaria ostoyae]|uniref:Uncharacterized protein n=1 Tax=Armillaria ostoyae TaxID=47428 RepID=A0A284S558_ARMOS|nr:uncharacterized protein ARMOST_19660 [Armillaria ostoyae]
MRRSWLSVSSSLLLVRFLSHGLSEFVNSLKAIKELANYKDTSVATVIFTYIILAFLASIITFASGQKYLENALFISVARSCWPGSNSKRSPSAASFFLTTRCPHSVPGSFHRFSTGSLYEWHSFAAIATPGQTGFSIIVISQAGAWSTEMK